MSSWDRRTFLRAGAFGTAGLVVDPTGRLRPPAVKAWNARTRRALRKFRAPAPTVCRVCPAHCCLLAFRDGDRVVQIQGNPGSPTNRGRLCPRAFAGLERLYDAERRLRPLRRIGERGSGRWAPISWEEALGALRERLGATRTGAVLHLGQEENLVQELRPALGWERVVVDRPYPGRPGPGSGARWYGAPSLPPDTAGRRTIYLFGDSPLEGRFALPWVQGLVAARRAGARLRLFGPWAGATAALGDWTPTRPGTEGAVAWGLARLLIQWKAFDLRAWPRALTDPVEALEQALAPYTPAAVSRHSDVPEQELVEAARTLAEGGAALAWAPPGSAAEPAAALLNHLAAPAEGRGVVAAAPGPFFVEALHPDGTPEAWLADLARGAARADLYWAVDANPAYDAPAGGGVARALADPERVGFLVAMDTHLTETAALADLFLPLATHFESWGLVEGALPDGRAYLLLQQPVTRPASEPDKLKAPDAEHLSLFVPWARPLGEARGLSDVLLDLARPLPGAHPRHRDTRAYLGELLQKSWGPGSFEALQRRGVWVSEEPPKTPAPPPVSFAAVVPPLAPPPAAASGEALQLVAIEPATVPRTYANARWGREILPRCEAFVHPRTARALGLEDGARAALATAAGKAVVRVRWLESVHPEAVALPDGFGHWAGGRAARAEPGTVDPGRQSPLARRTDPLSHPLGWVHNRVEPGEPIWWAEEGPGSSVRALMPFRIGPDGMQDWGPVPVTLRKI
ncbi:MAG: hypothetical protein Kow0092_17540 [Deferrisomatales bacterium]